LNPGVAQIGFWALADRTKLGKQAQLPVLPIAVKYRFLGDAVRYTEHRICRLEAAVGISAPTGNWRDRVFAIGQRIVETLEERYKLPNTGELPGRIERLKLRIIQRGFASLGLEQRKEGASLAEQMRALFNAVRDLKCEEPHSEYEEKLAAQRQRQVDAVLDDLNRIADNILISGHYVSDHPTCERLGDLLGRMEDEVFGRHARYPIREAHVRVSEPLPLEDYAEYGKDKRGAVAAATAEIAARIAGMLDDLASEGTPILPELWPRRVQPTTVT
ncbi:MAG TPA: hypothetical protein VFW40_07410, partial [Capsulimonadaceae bacterium]|nr:hypothetical protein [Capsulimonadaceae bacterium]